MIRHIFLQFSIILQNSQVLRYCFVLLLYFSFFNFYVKWEHPPKKIDVTNSNPGSGTFSKFANCSNSIIFQLINIFFL